MRYFIGFLVTVGLIILLIVLLFGGSSKPKTQTTQKPLISYADTDAKAKVTIDGPINYQGIHDQVQITVDRDQVVYDQVKGYDGQVVNQQIYPNTENAYNNFLHALTLAGYTHGNTSSSLQDWLGMCPLGARYVFELNQDGNTIQRFWSTTCGGTKTYNGNGPLTLTLFQNQVPNYSDLTQNLNLQS